MSEWCIESTWEKPKQSTWDHRVYATARRYKLWMISINEFRILKSSNELTEFTLCFQKYSAWNRNGVCLWKCSHHRSIGNWINLDILLECNFFYSIFEIPKSKISNMIEDYQYLKKNDKMIFLQWPKCHEFILISFEIKSKYFSPNML